jgi:hypothetical protein
LHRLANPAYLSDFLFHGLPCVAPYCAPDGSPTYTGHYREREQVIAQQFDDFIGTFSYSAVVTARGSDGSMLNFHVLERYSVNANGEVTVEFVKATC